MSPKLAADDNDKAPHEIEQYLGGKNDSQH